MRRSTSLLSVGAVAMAATAFPTVNLSAAAPDPVRPQVRTMPLTGVEPGSGHSPVAAGRRLAVLTGQRQVSSFSLLGVTWPGEAATDLQITVRTRTDGRWTGWNALETESDDRPDRPSTEGRRANLRNGTAPYYVGDSDGVQVLVASPDGTVPRDLRLDLVDPGRYEDKVAGTGVSSAASASASVAMPGIVTRAQWGADESLRTGAPTYAETIYAGFVHHTVNSNDYTAAAVPGIIRGIYAYHVKSRGWSDIGYNFLADKFGRLFEGRYGGVDRPVVGAHVGGFNAGSFGVAVIGDHTLVAPAEATIGALSDLVAWKLGLHRRDPVTTTVMNGITLRVVSGHRDAGSTECPGRYLYDKINTIRSRAAAKMRADNVMAGDWDGNGLDTAARFTDGEWVLRAAHGATSGETRFRYGTTGDIPVTGDWDGDGGTDIGVFRGNAWMLRMSATPGPAERTFSYGTTGDVPVTGDWDGDGGTDIGVFRGNAWKLRMSATPGPAQADFSYGRSTDSPVTGDWNGDGSDGPGVYRAGTWYLRNAVGGGSPDLSFGYGSSAYRPVTGNWDGDAPEEPGLVNSITWSLRNSLSSGSPEIKFVL